jgi:hypothetical protein
MRTFLISATLLAVAMMPAKADRSVTASERARLTDALAAQGCTGGKMEWDGDDREFEVEDAVCNGRKYELKFDAEFLFRGKKTDD